MAIKKISIAFSFVAAMSLFSCQSFHNKKPVDLVYPYLDAANSRWFYFSSACRPFGMVSLFPDTQLGGEWESGYRYNTDTIKDFSHIHEWQLSGVAVMPVTFNPNEITSIIKDHSSTFSHQTEVAYPGYHSVFLDRYQTKVELTATNRVGIHQVSFPEGKESGMVFQLCGQLGPSELIEGGFTQINETEISGYMVNSLTMRRPKPTPVYFYARFSHDIKEIHLSTPANTDSIANKWSGLGGDILVVLDNDETEPLVMKVGVSFTSTDGAKANLLAEAPSDDFEKYVTGANQIWDSMLSRIEIEGGTEQQQRRFYTDLWHAIQGRRTISDTDGKYADMTGPEKVIRQLPLDEKGKPKFNMYNSDAFWGAQWTLNTLWQLVYPEVANEFCNSFLEYYKNGGLIPRGPSGGNYTFVMTGASSTPFFVSAWQKGIRNFDINLAYDGLKKNHMPGGIMGKIGYEHKTNRGGGLEEYINLGYVPYPLSDTIFGSHQDGAGITLEEAYQDWCLAQLALALDKKEDYHYFLKRSDNFKNLYNMDLGYMVPKDREGNWKLPYDPLLYDNGFVEGNGAQLSWFVPHNLEPLFLLMRGRDTAVYRLNKEFEASRWHRFCNEHPYKKLQGDEKFIDLKRTWINYSNQPNSQAAFIFNHAGAPWLTQYWSRTVVDSCYSDLSPYKGYNGDEDQGLMGSLSVLMKIGLFQMTGGCEADPAYELGSPVFDKVTIHLDPDYYKAKTFTIETVGNAPDAPYIQKAELNGQPLDNYFFHHSDIQNGASLKIYMSGQPNKNWGVGKMADLSGQTKIYNIVDFGAMADSTTNNAEVIQKAIDQCSGDGGGVVLVPFGKTFMSGSFDLKSNINLYLEKGAVIRAWPDEEVYTQSAFKENFGEGSIWIGGKDAENVTISGSGTLDGNGIAFMGPEEAFAFALKPFDKIDRRPHLFTPINFKNLTIKGVTFRNSAYWCIHLVGCTDVKIDGINIYNHIKVRNSDGIDIDHSRNVDIRNCYIESGDDCVCPKTRREYEEYGPSENITVSNCVMRSSSCSIKLGSENMDAIRHVRFSDCIVYASNRGLGIQNRDEGIVEDVVFENITVNCKLNDDVWWGKAEPIYVTAYRRQSIGTKDASWRFAKGQTVGKVGKVSNIRFINIKANSENGIFVGGEPGMVSNIYFDKVNLTIDKISVIPGGIYDLRPSDTEGLKKDQTVGFYFQQGDEIHLTDCQVKWGNNKPVYFGNALFARNIKDIYLKNFKGEGAFANKKTVKLENSNVIDM